MENRNNKFTDEKTLDIHESDNSHLEKSYNNAKYVADKFGWQHILCVKDCEIRTIEDIQGEIIELVDNL